MYPFKNLNVDPNTINSAQTLARLSDEDDRITREKEKAQARRDETQLRQVALLERQASQIQKLQEELADERKQRELDEVKSRRWNRITFFASFAVSICAIVISIVLKFA